MATPAPAELPRLLRGLGPYGRPLSFRDHTYHHGPLPRFARRRSGEALIDLVAQSGLRGRGGAGFPAARKMASVAAGHRRPVVVANGAEGEPASAKDKVLLAQAPHLVLDGLMVAALAVGAREAIVATTAALAGVVRAAIAERAASGADPLRPVVATVPDRFLAGESSALVNFLNGGPSCRPRSHPGPTREGSVGAAPWSTTSRRWDILPLSLATELSGSAPSAPLMTQAQH